MDFAQLDILEEKISKTVKLLSELQAENNELKKYNMELINRVQEKEKMINQLLEECQNLKQNSEQSQTFKDKEEKIQLKVEEIITKLDNFLH